MKRCVAPFTLITALSLIGSSAVLAAGEPEKGAQVFKAKCAICHAVEAGRNKIGPSLAGIVGRKAGSVEGFHYSEANKNSGLTWDEATLDTYLTSPKDVVKGTTMAFPGLKNAQERADLIAYLKTVK
jgi:cytochrome c